MCRKCRVTEMTGHFGSGCVPDVYRWTCILFSSLPLTSCHTLHYDNMSEVYLLTLAAITVVIPPRWPSG